MEFEKRQEEYNKIVKQLDFSVSEILKSLIKQTSEIGVLGVLQAVLREENKDLILCDRAIEFEKRQQESDRIIGQLDYSIDEILRTLISESDEIEVTCTLDSIVTEKGYRAALFNWQGRKYPAEGGDLSIPTPDWVLTKEKINGTIKENSNPPNNDSNISGEAKNEKS